MASTRYRSVEETEAMVVRALTSHGLNREVIGQEFEVSGQLISGIRNGSRHPKVRTDLPRWRSCEGCIHWRRMACTLDFPEPEELGFWAAAWDCSAYVKR